MVILDGWGISKKNNDSAIFHAKTEFIDSLYNTYNHNILLTHGEHVGLPEGQMGNSEVGHMNLGAGRVVHQDLVKINISIADGSLKSNKILNDAINYSIKEDKREVKGRNPEFSSRRIIPFSSKWGSIVP